MNNLVKHVSILFLTFLLSFGNAGATIYYISPTGNDATGNGSLANPWKTLFKAANFVSAAGDIIHIAAGTYVETRQIQLKVGVSIEGEGAGTTILKSTLTADWIPMLILSSASQGTNGNQSISNLKFDGQNLSTFWGIQISARSNVSIHDCIIVDFKDRGILFQARSDNIASQPSIYATGNSFYNNTVLNCAAYNTSNGVYGRGNLCIGGQDGMLIYNNTITQNQRPNGYNGYCIKYDLNGFNKNVKIYDNIITKIPYGGAYPGENGWDFAIELWATQGGFEIYNNQVIGGAIDIDHATDPYGVGYSINIHNNTIYNTTSNDNFENGIILEGPGQENTIVENNVIYNKAAAITFSLRYGGTSNNIQIRNNLCYNIGRGSDGNDGFGIVVAWDNVGHTLSNLFIRNNTIIAKPGGAPWFGIKILGGPATSNNIYVQNNIVQGFISNGIVNDNRSATNLFVCQNNNLYQNGNNNNPVLPLGSSQTVSGNLKVNPLFVGGTNYTLQGTSPMIDKGFNVGRPFYGAAPDIGYAEYNGVAPPSNQAPTANAGADKANFYRSYSVFLYLVVFCLISALCFKIYSGRK